MNTLPMEHSESAPREVDSKVFLAVPVPPKEFLVGWGRNDIGQELFSESGCRLGTLDKESESNTSSAKILSGFGVPGDTVSLIACGFSSTAVYFEDGSLYMSGIVDQVVRTRQDPVRIQSPYTRERVVSISCGEDFVIVATESGSVVTWGNGAYGQLAHGNAVDWSGPHIVKNLKSRKVVQIAAGAFHWLALTDSGEVYACGLGRHGQTGLGHCEDTYAPRLIEALWGQPVIFVAAGENHSVVVTSTGFAFSFGSNKQRQLGISKQRLPETETRAEFPLRVYMPEELASDYFISAACGRSHTLFLTQGGKVLSCGNGQDGALGIEKVDKNIATPLVVESLFDYNIVQIVAGAKHSAALSSEGELLVWGSNNEEQLGLSESSMITSPVKFDFQHLFHKLQSTSEQPITQENNMNSFHVLRVAAGAFHTHPERSVSRAQELHPCFLANLKNVQWLSLRDFLPLQKKLAAISIFSHSFLYRIVREEDNSSSASKKYFRAVNPYILPFLTSNHETNRLEGTAIASNTEQNVGNSDNRPELLINAVAVETFYKEILSSHGSNAAELLTVVCREITSEAENKLTFGNRDNVNDSKPTAYSTLPARNYPEPGLALICLMMNPVLNTPGTGKHILVRLCMIVTSLKLGTQRSIVSAINRFPAELLAVRLVRPLHAIIDSELTELHRVTEKAIAATRVLGLLYAASELNGWRYAVLSHQEFYNRSISDLVDLKEDYNRWLYSLENANSRKSLFSFCGHPYVLDESAKTRVLYAEAREAMKSEVVRSLWMNSQTVVVGPWGIPFIAGTDSPYCYLHVRRASLVQDALSVISNADPRELRKPLRVVFLGEEGVDEGGLQKEFFQLIILELFAPDYGMFVYNEQTRYHWFCVDCFEVEDNFKLVGIIIGMAIYNGVILDLHFPPLIYKKLLDWPSDLDDVKEAFPEIGQSLQAVLEYEGDDMKEQFMMTFSTEYEFFGERRTYDLVPDGSKISLEQSNKQEFVQRYIEYLTDVSIHSQFDAFSKGFFWMLSGPALKIFRPDELEVLVCGQRHLDFEALERVTVYEGRFSQETPIVKWFWEIVHEMTLEEKLHLLSFVTGSDRAPVGGLGRLRFVIQRAGSDTDRLPTAHTCFNVLLLPEYSSKDKLRDRLLTAIKNAQGFGLQ
eukprot:jgi/Galph1/4318/GphlegSOOS_G2983.1